MKYYVGVNGKPTGPFDPQELLLKGLEPHTLVWNESMPDWGLAQDVPELAAVLGITAPAPEPVPTPAPEPAPAPEPTPIPEPAPKEEPSVGEITAAAAVATAATAAAVQPATAASQDIPEEHKPYANPDKGTPAQQAAPQAPPQQYVHQQYAQPQYAQDAQQPKQYMPEPVTNKWLSVASAVLSVICCCNIISLVLAIIGMTKASSAQKSYQSGIYDLAENEAKTARNMALYSVIALIAWPVILLVWTTIFDPETHQAFLEIFE